MVLFGTKMEMDETVWDHAVYSKSGRGCGHRPGLKAEARLQFDGARAESVLRLTKMLVKNVVLRVVQIQLVLTRRSGRDGTVVVFRHDLGAGKNINGGGATCDLLYAEAIAIVTVSSRAATVGSAGDAAFAVVDESVLAVVGHVAVGIIRVWRAADAVGGGAYRDRIRGTCARRNGLCSAIAKAIIGLR
jgi:hypothetical protein